MGMKFNLGNCLRCYLILVVDFIYLLPFYSLSLERKQVHFHNAPLLSTTFDEFQRSLAPLQIFEEKTRSQSQDPRHESSHTKRLFRNPNKADSYFSFRDATNG